MRDFGVALGLSVLVAVAAGCEEPVPANPSFEVDVKPIFAAHCVRCHGAGGTLNVDPRALNGYGTDHPNVLFLDYYTDQGDCTIDATGNYPPSCRHGAKGYVTTIEAYIHLKGNGRMPLAPAEPLPSWELSVIDRWVEIGAPDGPP